jgi:hypothetical protein
MPGLKHVATHCTRILMSMAMSMSDSEVACIFHQGMGSRNGMTGTGVRQLNCSSTGSMW